LALGKLLQPPQHQQLSQAQGQERDGLYPQLHPAVPPQPVTVAIGSSPHQQAQPFRQQGFHLVHDREGAPLGRKGAAQLQPFGKGSLQLLGPDPLLQQSHLCQTALHGRCTGLDFNPDGGGLKCP